MDSLAGSAASRVSQSLAHQVFAILSEPTYDLCLIQSCAICLAVLFANLWCPIVLSDLTFSQEIDR